MNHQNIIQTEIAGYRLIRHLGSGGMGDVYKAEHSSLGREAAVKILFNKEMANRFQNEAYIQSSVNHPGITKLYEYVSTATMHCIIMEYVEGENLDSYIHRKRKLSNEETENIVAQIASALSYLHKKGIIHRDIKPANFKIQNDGTVKMLDFGIAKHRYTPKFTQEGFVIGTSEYMSPEQFQESVEIKSDIWSLGVMTYEMVTGYLPFESTNPVSLRNKVMKGSFTNPKIMVPALSDKLSTIVDKSLQIKSTQRLSAMEIENILNGNVQQSFQASFKAGIKKFPKKNMQIAAIGAVVLMFIILVIAPAMGDNNPTKQSQDPDEIITQDSITKPPPGLQSTMRNIRINVPGLDNAMIILPNGEKKKLPFELSGQLGEQMAFIIQADGFREQKINLQVNDRRESYDYNLEKIK